MDWFVCAHKERQIKMSTNTRCGRQFALLSAKSKRVAELVRNVCADSLCLSHTATNCTSANTHPDNIVRMVVRQVSMHSILCSILWAYIKGVSRVAPCNRNGWNFAENECTVWTVTSVRSVLTSGSGLRCHSSTDAEVMWIWIVSGPVPTSQRTPCDSATIRGSCTTTTWAAVLPHLLQSVDVVVLPEFGRVVCVTASRRGTLASTRATRWCRPCHKPKPFKGFTAEQHDRDAHEQLHCLPQRTSSEFPMYNLQSSSSPSSALVHFSTSSVT